MGANFSGLSSSDDENRRFRRYFIDSSDSEDLMEETLEDGECDMPFYIENFPSLQMHPFEPAEPTGVKADVTNFKEIDFFKMFIDDHLINMLVEETNRNYAIYAQNENNVAEQSEEWHDTDKDEMYLFVGIWASIAHEERSNIDAYWSMKKSQYDPFYHFAMTKDRFKMLFGLLRFVNADDMVAEEPFSVIQPVVEHLRKKFSEYFYPDKDIFLDQSVCLYRGKLLIKCYVPHTSRGIKIYTITDAKTGYILDFLLCSESSKEITKKMPSLTAAENIVMTLYSPYLQRGHNVLFKSRLATHKLVKMLTDAKTNIRSMMKHPSLICQNIPIKEATIDNVDQVTEALMLQMLISKRFILRNKSIKWYKKIFLHLLDLTLLNAFTLFSETGGKKSLDKFAENILDQLLKAHVPPEKKRKIVLEIPLYRLGGRHFICPIRPKGKPELCLVCLNTTVRERENKLTKFYCKLCDVPLCVSPCFKTFHSKEKF